MCSAARIPAGLKAQEQVEFVFAVFVLLQREQVWWTCVILLLHLHDWLFKMIECLHVYTWVHRTSIFLFFLFFIFVLFDSWIKNISTPASYRVICYTETHSSNTHSLDNILNKNKLNKTQLPHLAATTKNIFRTFFATWASNYYFWAQAWSTRLTTLRLISENFN